MKIGILVDIIKEEYDLEEISQIVKLLKKHLEEEILRIETLILEQNEDLFD